MSIATIDPNTRKVPPLGGFNLTLIRIELRRMVRNRRTIIFALVFPTAMFFVFGSGKQGNEQLGHGLHGNVSAYVMVSMALYGGALLAAAGGGMVATERALRWSRQLRLTPLYPVAYIAVKPGMEANEQDLIEHTRERLAPYKYPRSVTILASLPKGPTGKILKRELRA